MPTLTPNLEQQVTDALIAIGLVETEPSLKAEGVLAVRRVLGCSADEAQGILNDLENRKLIEADITPRGGQLYARQPMPVAHWCWHRPQKQF
jgi:hypothetical protein